MGESEGVLLREVAAHKWWKERAKELLWIENFHIFIAIHSIRWSHLKKKKKKRMKERERENCPSSKFWLFSLFFHVKIFNQMFQMTAVESLWTISSIHHSLGVELFFIFLPLGPSKLNSTKKNLKYQLLLILIACDCFYY